MSENPVFQLIQSELKAHPIVLFMKGTAAMPLCGFSQTVVNLLKNLGVPFKDINVLSNPVLRQGIKDFTNWPTIPQLYIKEEFIGGCDIVRALSESGELEKILKNHQLLS